MITTEQLKLSVSSVLGHNLHSDNKCSTILEESNTSDLDVVLTQQMLPLIPICKKIHYWDSSIRSLLQGYHFTFCHHSDGS